MIIGIVGWNCSGKDTAAKYLESKGFKHYSLSDEIRFELNDRGLRITRDSLIEVGNRMRRKFGPDILAQRVLAKAESDKKIVITSVRNIHEAYLIQKLGILIHVKCDVHERLRRMIARGRENDPKTYEELIEKEKIEKSSDENEQNISETLRMAAHVFVNEDLKELHKQIDEFLEKEIEG